MLIDTNLSGFKLRFAQPGDVTLVLKFIKELAEYEKMLDEVKATEDLIREALFERKIAEVIIGEYQNKPVSFALGEKISLIEMTRTSVSSQAELLSVNRTSVYRQPLVQKQWRSMPISGL